MIIPKKDFCDYVEEQYAKNEKTMIDTIIDACAKYSIDLELCKPFLNRSIIEKTELDFIDMNYLKKEVNSVV